MGKKQVVGGGSEEHAIITALFAGTGTAKVALEGLASPLPLPVTAPLAQSKPIQTSPILQLRPVLTCF